jgi:hypothetical protein
MRSTSSPGHACKSACRPRPVSNEQRLTSRALASLQAWASSAPVPAALTAKPLRSISPPVPASTSVAAARSACSSSCSCVKRRRRTARSAALAFAGKKTSASPAWSSTSSAWLHTAAMHSVLSRGGGGYPAAIASGRAAETLKRATWRLSAHEGPFACSLPATRCMQCAHHGSVVSGLGLVQLPKRRGPAPQLRVRSSQPRRLRTMTAAGVTVKEVPTTKIDGQKTGTSGLRKKAKEFSSGNYLANWVQSLFNALPAEQKARLGTALVAACRPGRRAPLRRGGPPVPLCHTLTGVYLPVACAPLPRWARPLFSAATGGGTTRRLPR